MKLLKIFIGGLGLRTLKDLPLELKNDCLFLDSHLKNPIEGINTITPQNGKGAGGDIYKGIESFDSIKQEVAETVKGYDIVLIVAGLGGGTGSGYTYELVQLCKELNIKSFALANTLRTYEKDKKSQFELAIEQVRLSSSYTLISSKSIERAIGDDRADKYELYFSNQAIKFIQTLELILNRSSIDKADINQHLPNGELHLAFSDKADSKKLLDDSFYAHNIEYLRSYLLIHSNLSMNELNGLVRNIESDCDIQSKKIENITSKGKFCLLIGSLDAKLDAPDAKLDATQTHLFNRQTQLNLNWTQDTDAEITTLDAQSDALRRNPDAPVKNQVLELMTDDEDLTNLVITKSSEGGKSAQQVADYIMRVYNVQATKNVIESLRR